MKVAGHIVFVNICFSTVKNQNATFSITIQIVNRSSNQPFNSFEESVMSKNVLFFSLYEEVSLGSNVI